MKNKPVKTALVYAVDLLSRRNYGTAELRSKLCRKGYTDDETEAAVDKLKERGYLNDAAFLESAVACYRDMEKYSWQEITYRLQRKGFSRSAVAEYRHMVSEADELRAASRAVSAKSKSVDMDLMKVKRRLYAHGFSLSVIEKACDSIVRLDTTPKNL